jgi:hypothetical protein
MEVVEISENINEPLVQKKIKSPAYFVIAVLQEEI